MRGSCLIHSCLRHGAQAGGAVFALALLLAVASPSRAQTNAPKRLTRDSPIADFIATLDNGDADRVETATELLALMGTNARPAVPALARVIERVPRTRESALYVLGAIGPAAADAMPALIRTLGAYPQSSSLRFYAARSLAEIGDASIPALQDAARSTDPIVAIWARAALVRSEGSNSPSLLFLADRVQHGGAQDCSEALTAIQMLGPQAAPIVPQLVSAAQTNQIARGEFVRTFTQIGKGAMAALPMVIAVAATTKETDKFWALQALTAIDGPGAEAAVPVLVDALNVEISAGSLPIHEQAAEALGAIGPDASAAIPALIKTIHDPDVRSRAAAIDAISRIDPLNPVALKEIAPAMLDTDFRVQYAANAALAKAGPVNLDVIQGFIRAVLAQPENTFAGNFYDGPPDNIVPTSSDFFYQFGPKQRYALSNLVDMAASTNSGVQRMALGAMSRIGEVPERFIPVMLEHLDDDYGVLKAMGPKAAAAVPSLVKLLDDPRRAPIAVDILVAIGSPAAKPAIPKLEELVRDGKPPYPRFCADLYQLDSKSAVALDGLERLAATSPDPQNIEPWGWDVVDAHALLIRAGRNADAHYRYLSAVLLNTNERTASWAARGIMFLDPGNPARSNAVERCFKFFDSGRDEWAVEYAAQGFSQFGPQDKEYAPRLIKIISQPPTKERLRAVCSAIGALGNIGPGAREAVPQLQAIADRKIQAPEDWEDTPLAYRSETPYQKAAADALEKIRGGEGEP